MLRRAEWRVLPDEPRGPGEFLGHVAREAWRHRASVVGLALLVWLGPAVAALLWMGLRWGIAAGAVSFAGLIFVSPRLAHRFLNRRIRRPLGNLGRLLPLPLPPGTFPVYMAIRNDTALTGLDEASATFVDGWLHVEGRRASFAVRVVDAKWLCSPGVLHLSLPDSQKVVLRLAEDRTIEINPLEFARAAQGWLQALETPVGEPILPPLATLPAVRRGTLALCLGGLLLVASTLPFLPTPWMQGGLLGALRLALAILGTVTLLRNLFALKEQGDADRRAKSLPALQERGRLVR